MEKQRKILVEECCKHYRIETSFVTGLNERGLIELEQSSATYFIDEDQLALLEKYMHFHYDLDINMEGIEAISHLLEKIEALQSRLRSLEQQ